MIDLGSRIVYLRYAIKKSIQYSGGSIRTFRFDVICGSLPTGLGKGSAILLSTHNQTGISAALSPARFSSLARVYEGRPLSPGCRHFYATAVEHGRSNVQHAIVSPHPRPAAKGRPSSSPFHGFTESLGRVISGRSSDMAVY